MKSLIYFIICLTHVLANASECPVGKYPVSAHSRTEYYRNDGTHVNATDVNSSCREYRLQKPLIVNFSKNTPKGWPHKREKFRNWTEKEKTVVTKALNELPAILTQIGELKIYRAIKSEIPDNPSTSGLEDKIITLYDNVSKHELKRVLAHELAHIYYFSMSREEIKSYNEIAQWNENQRTGIFWTDRKSFSADDGKIGPEEDFANNLETFYFDRKTIEKDQMIFKWIKKMVGEE